MRREDGERARLQVQKASSGRSCKLASREHLMLSWSKVLEEGVERLCDGVVSQCL
jgi:hypothetical protein